MTSDARKRSFIDYPFRQHRQVRFGFLLLLLALNLIYSAFVNLAVFEREWLTPLALASQGLLQPGLIAYLVKIPLFLTLLFWGGQLRPKDLGLRKSQLPVGIAVMILLWLVVQGIGLAATLIVTDGLALAPRWAQADLFRMAGIQVANAANVLFEETFFRGFLLIQFYLWLGKRDGASSSQGRIFLAVMISQLIFAFSHIPIRLYQDMPFASLAYDQFMLLGLGALYALIFLRSTNLFVAMAVHFLANTPIALFLSANTGRDLVLLLGLAMLFLWRPLAGTLVRVHSATSNGRT